MKHNELVEYFNAPDFNPFYYLQQVHGILSNAKQKDKGRELIIRALDKIEKFTHYEALLKDLVVKTGLYPYLYSDFEKHSVEEKLLVEMYRSDFDKDFVFHSLQQRIYQYLMNGQNVILSAPTSVGKSAVVDTLIASNKYKKIVIVVPTIALIDETRRRIYRKFKNEYEIIHHNIQNAKSEKIVYILTQERVIERNDIREIDLFIIDEFYKLAFKDNQDNERAISLNIALSKLLLVSKQFYMIGPNIDDIRGVKNLQDDYVFIPSGFNTVALNVYDEYKIKPSDIENKNKALAKILKDVEGQTIIYCKSPSSASDVANFITEIESREERDSPYIQWIKDNYSEDWGYYKAITRGIGLHHGSLPRAIQQITVNLFNNKQIKYLICTSTIIEGVNTVARNVVIYDNRNGTYSIDRFTHNNIKGRAGRMKEHYVGNVFCLEKVPENKFETRVVDIPLGNQGEHTPLNLLTGVEEKHVQEVVKERVESYINSSLVPLPILKKYATYSPDNIKDGYKFIADLDKTQLQLLATKKLPNGEILNYMTRFLKNVNTYTLQRYNLLSNDELFEILVQYLYADTHHDYFRKRIQIARNNGKSGKALSKKIDEELSIARNLIGFTIPKTLSLLQDLVNHDLKKREISKEADYSRMILIFENFHLPSNLSALLEMGVPVQTLAKIKDKELFELELNDLVEVLKNRKFESFSKYDNALMQRALR